MQLRRTTGEVRWAPLALVYFLPALTINIGNAAAYLFQVLLGRTLDVAQFGAFNALFSALLILTAPAGFLQFLVAQASLATTQPGEQRRLLTTFSTAALALSVGLGLVGLAVSGLGGMKLGLDPLILTGAFLTILFSCLHPVAVGLLLARRKYIRASYVIGGNPLVRLVLGFLLVFAAAGGVTGALWAVAIPVGAAFLLGLVFLRDLWAGPSLPLPPAARETIRHAGWRQLVSLSLLTLISNIDVVMARFVLPPLDAGIYSGAAVISRICLLLPAALATVIFSESAAGRSRVGGVQPGLVLTVGIAVICALFAVVAAGPIMTLVMGPAFAPSGDVLRLLGPAMGILAVANGLAMHLTGVKRYAYLVPLALGSCLFLVVPPMANGSPIELATAVLLLHVVTLGGVVAAMVWQPGWPALLRPRSGAQR